MYILLQSACAVGGEHNKPVALKITKTKRVPSRIGDMNREVYAKLSRLKHRNIVCSILPSVVVMMLIVRVSFAGCIL